MRNQIQICDLKVIFQNINGWYGKEDALKLYYSQENPDIILLAHTNHFPPRSAIKIHPYIVYTCNTAQLYSGVAILVKRDIEHSLIDKKFDGDTLAIKVETSIGPIIIGTNYSPPSRPNIPVRDIMWFSRHRSPVYLLADLNAHHSSYDTHTNSYGRMLYNMWLEEGYLRRLGPVVGTFTSYLGNITKPDIVLTNRNIYHYAHITTLDQNVSDHAPICLKLSYKPIKLPAAEHEIIKKANWELFKDNIKSKLTPINLNNKNYQNINTTLDKIEITVNEAQNLAIPKSKIKYSARYDPSPKFQRFKKILTQIYHLIRINANNNQILTHLRKQKSKVINIIKEEATEMQRKNWDELIKKLDNNRLLNPRDFWSRVKPLIFGSQANAIKVTNTGDRTGNVLTKAEEIEPKFREEWVKHFKRPPVDKIDPISLQQTITFHQNHPDLANPLPLIDISRLTPGDPLLKPFRPIEIVNIFQTFKNKAPGPDNIKKIHIEHFPKILFVIITQLFNYCLSTGHYPPKFKTGIMIFIPKPGKDHSNPANYRPITLLNLIGKAFGKLVNQRFVNHMTSENLLNPTQYGFRRGRGTASSLALMYEFVSKKTGSDQFQRVSVVSRDISGAFDRVWHEKLITLFDRLRLPHLFIKILTSFLTDRQIKIRIFNYIGPAFTPEAGVPQGAPDSPDIFNVSTLPLDDIVPTPNTYSPWYCDDMHEFVATISGKNCKGRHKNHIIAAIKNQNAFEKSRGILTCVEKSVITSVAQIERGNLEFNVGGERLKYPYLSKGKSTKILGLHITTSSWQVKQSEESSKKAKHIVGCLYNMNGLSQSAKLHLIKMLVIPTLTYPCTPLNASSTACFARLQTAQNKALNFVFNNRYPDLETSKSLHIRAKLSPINQNIYKQAKKIWEKIEAGTAADIVSYNKIMREPQGRSHRNYPSSHARAQKAEPPPIYNIKDSRSPAVKLYYES